MSRPDGGDGWAGVILALIGSVIMLVLYALWAFIRAILSILVRAAMK